MHFLLMTNVLAFSFRGDFGKLRGVETFVTLLMHSVRNACRGFVFSRDPRQSVPAMDLLSEVLHNQVNISRDDNMFQVDQLDAAESIRCPHLVIEAEDGAKFNPDIFSNVLEVYRTNPLFEHVIVPGTHHVHLDTPLVVATVIKRWWGEQSVARVMSRL